MKGTNAVKQYFAKGKSKYITPSVSAEWNYNLFYAPYTTVNGSGAAVTDSGGTLVSTKFLTINNWTTKPSVSTSGRITSTFLNDPNYSTRSCLAFPALNGGGNSKITIALASNTNTYKITFYAKLDTDGIANLSALAYVDHHRSHSDSKQIDSVTWTKFEVYVSSRPIDTAYSSFDFIFDYQAADSSQTYNVLIDQIRVDRTTDFEYQYGNLWPTKSPFGIFRPGESHVPAGSILTQNNSEFRKIKSNFGTQKIDGTWNSSTWDNQIMPASRVVFHPSIIGTNKLNPVYKNGSLSEFTRYKYFVADKNTPSISALYDNVLNVNKIVIKFNLAYSTPSAFTVNLYKVLNDWTNKDQTTTYATVSLTSSDIDSSGTCILYLQTDGTWKSGKAGYSWSTMPSFDFDGDVTFDGAQGGTVTAYKQINKITVTQTSSTVNSAYSTNVNSNIVKGSSSSINSVSSEMGRMQVVEISPRLEVDLSYYTMSISTNEQLDNKQNPLPISAISSNMATITLSNVPLKVSSQVLSLFSNNSTDSLLKGLFKNYVKFYINYLIKDDVPNETVASNKVIRGGVYYADSWDGRDIERTTVTAYDISKYLQILQPTDFVSKSQDVFKTISNILDFAGFSDYDYDSLKRVTNKSVGQSGNTKNNTTPIEMQFFAVDGQAQKVFDVLREIFEVYQIGAYIDSYGVMKFLNIDMILDNNKSIDLLLHDNNADQSVTTDLGYTSNLVISPNIVQDTYTETVKTKVGKITIKYKTPQIKKPIAADSKLLNQDLYYNDSPRYTRSTNTIWSLTDDESTTFNHLDRSMYKSQGYFLIPTPEARGTSDVVNFNQYGIDHDGFAIIENEIVSFKEKEWAFDIYNPENKKTDTYYRLVSNSSELEAAKAEIFNISGINSDVVRSQPTGKITSVQRGLFNTPVSDHLVLDNNNIGSKFITESGFTSISNSSDKQLSYLTSMKITSNGNSAIVIANDPYRFTNTYKTFSVKVGMGLHLSTPHDATSIDNAVTGFKKTLKSGDLLSPTINPTVVAGTRAGIVLHNSAGSPTVYVSLLKSKVGGIDLYVTSDAAGKTSLLTTEYIPVGDLLLEDAIEYSPASPFSTYAKFINLKFVKVENSINAFEVFINKKRVTLKTISNTAPNTSGKYGAFVYNDTTSTVEFTEIYATQSAINTPDYFYHYQLPWFAEKLSSNKKIFEISYMAQVRPEIVGISYYDVKNTFASFDAYPVKSSYDWYYYPFPSTVGKADGSKMTMAKMVVNNNSLTYSPIYHSGWRSRFAVINNSPSQVWLRKTQDDGINKLQIEFNLVSQSVLTSGNEVTVEKIFDEAGASDSVDVTSNWIQDRKTAQSILRVIYRALDGFSRDTNVSVFGNPLFEIGDVVKVNYDLKNIKNQIYFVQGVEQSFQGGLSTVLVLNQIAFEKSLPSQPYIDPGLSSSAAQLPPGTPTVSTQYQLSWSLSNSYNILPGKLTASGNGYGTGDFVNCGYGTTPMYAPIGVPYSWGIFETAVNVSDPTTPTPSQTSQTSTAVQTGNITYQMTLAYGGTPGAIEGGALVATGSGTGTGSWVDPGYGIAKFYGIQGVPYSFRVYSIKSSEAVTPVTSTPTVTDSTTVVAPPSNGTTYSRTVGIQYNATNFSITDPTDIKVGYIITSSGGNFESGTTVSSITGNAIVTSKPILSGLSQGQSGIIFTVPTYTADANITAPTNVQIVGNTITWTMAPNSTLTAISINGVLTRTTSGTSYTFTGLRPEGIYFVALQGMSPGGPIGTAAILPINAF